MSTQSALDRNTVPPRINVTPLIDVLLVLLIIFMVISPRREQKLPVTAPQLADGTSSPETLMLEVGSDLQLALNSKTLTSGELFQVLADVMEERPVEHRTLIIKAPQGIPYDPVASLIDRAKGAGVMTIGLARGGL